jgi:serine/threonine protein kinase
MHPDDIPPPQDSPGDDRTDVDAGEPKAVSASESAEAAAEAATVASSAGPADDAADPAGPSLPEQVGKYRVRELLAHGGMGAVYLAEQENPQRTVALKVIRPGHATSELMRRFENEAQVLGLLQHPGIAQIYEAGTADAGH